MELISWLRRSHWHFGAWRVVEELGGVNLMVVEECLYCGKRRTTSKDCH